MQKLKHDPKIEAGVTFGESCWKALTPEYRSLIESASDDWIEGQYRYWLGKMTDGSLSVEEDAVMISIGRESDRRGLKRSVSWLRLASDLNDDR